VASELYVQVPAGYGDFWSAGPDSPTFKLMDYGTATGHLLNLHMQMVLYSIRQRTAGFISEGAVGYFCRPASRRIAKRDAMRLVDAGLIEITEGGYYVPAAEEWQVIRVGKRDRIPDFVRERVYKRDGYRCVECGADEDLTLDHVIPWSRNGSDKEDNLRTLCGSCNSTKGARV
jgi:hypothetical protein